ncbi:7707_t:CDS:2, partial [Cetraspora pellucida]
ISKKSVILEDESLSTNNNIELTHKNDGKTVQRTALTNVESVQKSGLKQDLVDCLVNESQKRLVLLALDSSGKEKEVDFENSMKKVSEEGDKLNFELGKVFANVFNNVLVMVENF